MDRFNYDLLLREGTILFLEKYIISSTATILEAIKKIDINEKGFILVTNHLKQLLGTITDGDIRRSLIQGYTLESNALEIAQNNFKYIRITDSFEDVVRRFQDKQVNFFPILDLDNKLINVITKKQLHLFLLKDLTWNSTLNFSEMDEEQLVHEIYNRPWGYYKTVLLSNFAQAKIICVYPNGKLSLQEHKLREEHWIVVKGSGKLTIGESQKFVSEGVYAFIPKGCKHTIENTSSENNLFISEVQLGTYFGEDDIIRYEDIYNRI